MHLSVPNRFRLRQLYRVAAPLALAGVVVLAPSYAWADQAKHTSKPAAHPAKTASSKSSKSASSHAKAKAKPHTAAAAKAGDTDAVQLSAKSDDAAEQLDPTSVASAVAMQDALEAVFRSLPSEDGPVSTADDATLEALVAKAAAQAQAAQDASDDAPAQNAAPAASQSPVREIVPKLRHRVVQAALSWIGTRYRFGGDTPAGFDCSGLVHFVFRETVGMDLPRVAREQRHTGREVAKDELKPGDLVFFNTRRDPNSHVGIYIGNDRFLHAPSRGSLVRVDTLHSSYWAPRFTGARRLITGKTLAVLPSALGAIEN
jgi:cell wall-associated NlpC family hydrolase